MAVTTVASDADLDNFLRWAHAAGYRILEHPDYGGVTPSLHIPTSYHPRGMAADLNWGPPGAPASEMSKLAKASRVAQSIGLGCILALKGTGGSAKNHRDHLHVDRSSSTNFGAGYTRTPAGTRTPQKLQRAAHFSWADSDNLWGPDTDARLEAIRAASRLHGSKTPDVKLAQRAVGTRTDGVWGEASRAAHDDTVADVQRALSVAIDGVWGPKTDQAYTRARKAYHR